MQHITFGRPVFTEDEIAEVAKILQGGWVSTGPKVQEFEEAFAQYIGTPAAVGVSSCTAALHLSLKAIGVGPGDEVITTAMTFAATINAILMCGATPVLVDCEPVHHNLDLNAVERALTKKTKAIVPVQHPAVAPIDIDRSAGIRRKAGVRVVHDCAHAIETEWQGKKAGSFDDVSCFSFYPTKNMTTIEGGMICTSDPEIIQQTRLMRNHGMWFEDAWKRFADVKHQHYDIKTLGFKYNMTDIQAGLGILQLERIEERYKIRNKIWKTYQSGLQGLRLTTRRMCRRKTAMPITSIAFKHPTASAMNGRTNFKKAALAPASTTRPFHRSLITRKSSAGRPLIFPTHWLLGNGHCLCHSVLF